ncbi:hypothetical protein RYZ26_00745 [Terasakiella sp. A23]|nr:hypothetical protein [Terasakiella sp. A23]
MTRSILTLSFLLFFLTACSMNGKLVTTSDGQCTYNEYEVISKIVGLNDYDATFRIDASRPFIHVPLRQFNQLPQLGEIYIIGVREIMKGSCRPFYTWVVEQLLDT